MKYHVLLLALLIPRLAFADPPAIQAVPPGDDKIVVVREGEKVPFSGQLFDSATALRWGNWLQQYRAALAIGVEREQEICKARLDFDAKTTAIEKLRTDGIEKDLRKRLLDSDTARVKLQYQLDHPPWYKEFWFQASVGVLVTLGATYAAAQVLSSH